MEPSRQAEKWSELTATLWNELDEAMRGDPQSIGRMYLKYFAVVQRTLEWVLPPVADAPYEASRVMDTILNPSFLKEKAHPTKGRFRYLIRAVTLNHARNVRKRPDVKDYVTIDPTTIQLPAREENRIFDVCYAQEVWRKAMDRLRTVCVKAGRLRWEVLHLAYDEGMEYEEIARCLNRTVAWVTNQMHRGRKELHDFFRMILQASCSSEKEVLSETEYLWALALKHARRRRRRDL